MARTKTVQGELVVDEIAIRSQFAFDATAIATTTQRISAITIVDRATFDDAWEIRQDLRGLRVGIDKERKRLTEKARSYTDMVNGVAKSILSHIVPAEEMIIAKVDHYETAEAERKKAYEIAKQQALQKRIDELLAVDHHPNNFMISIMPEEEYQALLAEMTGFYLANNQLKEAERVEAKRIADEQAAAAEQARLKDEAARKAERIELDRIAAEQAAERKLLDDRKRELDEAERKVRKERQDEENRIESKRRSDERTEANRLAAEKREADRIENERLAKLAEEQRLATCEALKPDVEKLLAFASELQNPAIPQVQSNDAMILLGSVLVVLHKEADRIIAFCEAAK